MGRGANITFNILDAGGESLQVSKFTDAVFAACFISLTSQEGAVTSIRAEYCEVAGFVSESRNASFIWAGGPGREEVIDAYTTIEPTSSQFPRAIPDALLKRAVA